MFPSSLSLLPNWAHWHLHETDSTMQQMRRSEYAVPAGKDFALLTADWQTAGRGQRGTHWEADAGKNLLFSLRFEPRGVLAAEQFALSEALALGIRAALSAYGEGFSVKWPNDIYWNDQKACGILLEHQLQGSLIVETIAGVGINVNQETFRSDAPNPVSLRQITGRPTPLAPLLQSVLAEFELRLRKVQQGRYAELHEEYRIHLFHGEGLHAYYDVAREQTFEAEISRISPLGMLTLRLPNGTERSYAFKEVKTIIHGGKTL